ncbi:MAG: hypothetical protein HY054_14650 [Proteobacteria bacterium]|nr:hypothetical protein [Pseudomonadota bacterium]
MRLALALISFFGVFTLSACTTDAAPASSGPATITMTRTVCFGFCPAYTVTITSDGQVTYVGSSFVNVTGEQHASISPEAVQGLLRGFDAAQFESLNDAYRTNVTDLPTYTIVLERNGRRKTVVDYGGLGAGMPQAVRDLQTEIDRIAGTSRWILRDGQPVQTPPEH